MNNQVLYWTPDCSVGNAVLDAQHLKMLEICNEIGRHLEDPANSSDFHELLNELVTISYVHLKTEEDVLRVNAYPDYEAHKAEHDKHREALTELLWVALQHNLDFKTLHNFTVNWWSNHVLKSDIKAKSYLKD